MTSPKRIHVEAKRCRGCETCVLACSLHHEGTCNPDMARLVVAKDMARYEFDILICQHCDAPDCILACPNDAMAMDDRGVVFMVDEDCDRCGACAASCPYDAILYNEDQDRYLKCDLCANREGGPLCVELCPVGALTLAEVKAVRHCQKQKENRRDQGARGEFQREET